MTIEKILEKVSDEELKAAFAELSEWRKTGVLVKEGVVRKYHNEFQTQNNFDFPIHAIEVHFLFEMAKRAYGENATV